MRGSRSTVEAAPRLAGAAIAPEVLLAGPLHTVGEPVAVEGFMGRYEIRSTFGKFNVAGVEMLTTRVRELAAIETLDQIEKSAEFQQALVRTAQAPVQFVGNAFTDPGATVESVVTGVGTVLGRVGRLAHDRRTRGRRCGERRDDGENADRSGHRNHRASRCRPPSPATRSASTARGDSGRSASTSIPTRRIRSCARCWMRRRA